MAFSLARSLSTRVRGARSVYLSRSCLEWQRGCVPFVAGTENFREPAPKPRPKVGGKVVGVDGFFLRFFACSSDLFTFRLLLSLGSCWVE